MPPLNERCGPGAEVGAIPIIPKDGAALDPPYYDMVEDAGRIEARTAGHGTKRTRVGPGKECIAAIAVTSPLFPFRDDPERSTNDLFAPCPFSPGNTS